jgi:hypothetical protein
MNTQAERFEKHQTYFLFGYYDRKFRFPYIKTLVYLGKNLESKSQTDYWYFQSAESFEEDVTPKWDNAEQSGILVVGAEGLEGIIDARGLIDELSKPGRVKSETLSAG